MSEPNSLFAKIHISKDNFDSFLRTKPSTPQLNDDWIAWWDASEMYGKTPLQEKDLHCYKNATNEEIINGWKENIQSLTFSDYDAENELWHFGIIFFTENYLDMIPGLSFIKSIAGFKKENSEDFGIVYNYFWGDNYVCAFINYENGEGFFNTKIKRRADINLDTLTNMEVYLKNKWNEFEEAGLTEDD